MPNNQKEYKEIFHSLYSFFKYSIKIQKQSQNLVLNYRYSEKSTIRSGQDPSTAGVFSV